MPQLLRNVGYWTVYGLIALAVIVFLLVMSIVGLGALAAITLLSIWLFSLYRAGARIAIERKGGWKVIGGLPRNLDGQKFYLIDRFYIRKWCIRNLFNIALLTIFLLYVLFSLYLVLMPIRYHSASGNTGFLFAAAFLTVFLIWFGSYCIKALARLRPAKPKAVLWVGNSNSS